jgi:general secretion pathway protein L
MSILIISLPPRPRLRSRSAEPEAAETSSDDEFDYLLSADGFTVQSQGRCAASLLPHADSAVAVVCDTDIAWHRITLPKATAPRLRAALGGLLEEAVLEDEALVHFAVAPQPIAGQPTWVAALHRPWLSNKLATLERSEVFVDRVVPLSWPDDPPSGHFSQASKARSGEDLVLTWAHADGVVVLRVQGGLARSLLPQPLPPGSRWSAAPEVAAAAESWLGSPVAVVSASERALHATRTLWDLRQFDLTRRDRGTRALRDLLRRWSSPLWRPVRYGLIALAAAQVIGLNLGAWHHRSELTAKRKAMVSLMQTSFPQVRAVLDAPLQMQREVNALRAMAGRPSENDFEPQLLAAASAWPPGKPPVASVRFEPGRLTLAAAGWSDAETERFRSQLRPAGWQVDASEGRLAISRAGSLP